MRKLLVFTLGAFLLTSCAQEEKEETTEKNTHTVVENTQEFPEVVDPAVQNLEEGQKFLEENAQREGVVVLESGLQYEVIEEGTGDIPTASDRVLTHYHGTHIDGRVFDSSVERGEPIDFGVQEVIRGWTEALQLMKTGAKWKLYIPSDLAYGAYGGGPIGPNEVLVFDIELISIVK